MQVGLFTKQLLRALFSRDKTIRYESQHGVLQGLAVRSGFRLYNKNLTWLTDDEFLTVWQEFPEANANIHERKFNLFQIAQGLQNVPGDLAECGVFRGGSSFLMLKATETSGKYLHGFDSFEGLSKPQVEDQVTNDYTFKWHEHDMSVGAELPRKNLAAYSDRFELHVGWIPDRFQAVANQAFCLVHIDVDLYQPTLEAAKFFYARLNPGGMLVCDDYGFESCPGARRAMDEVAANAGTRVIHLTTGQGLLCKNQ